MPMMRRPTSLAELVFGSAPPASGSEVDWPIDASAITPALGMIRFGAPRATEESRKFRAMLEDFAKNWVGGTDTARGANPIGPSMVAREVSDPMYPWVRPMTTDLGGSSTPPVHDIAQTGPEYLRKLMSESQAQQQADRSAYERLLYASGIRGGPVGLGPKSALPKQQPPTRPMPSRLDLE